MDVSLLIKYPIVDCVWMVTVVEGVNEGAVIPESEIWIGVVQMLLTDALSSVKLFPETVHITPEGNDRKVPPEIIN